MQDGSTTTVTSFVKSYDFDLQASQKNAQGKSTVDLLLSGDVIFSYCEDLYQTLKHLQGNAKVTLAVKRYPQQSETTSSS